MVRKHKPRNPYAPGSKLAPSRTLEIICYLLSGRPSALIAAQMSISKNTVSTTSAKFRKKIRTSPAVRQACFELFYGGGHLQREIYIHLLDGPDAARPGYFADFETCVFRCPSAFLLKTASFPRFIFASNRRLLNLSQSQPFHGAGTRSRKPIIEK
jgi:hypothetical protein